MTNLAMKAKKIQKTKAKIIKRIFLMLLKSVKKALKNTTCSSSQKMTMMIFMKSQAVTRIESISNQIDDFDEKSRQIIDNFVKQDNDNNNDNKDEKDEKEVNKNQNIFLSFNNIKSKNDDSKTKETENATNIIDEMANLFTNKNVDDGENSGGEEADFDSFYDQTETSNEIVIQIRGSEYDESEEFSSQSKEKEENDKEKVDNECQIAENGNMKCNDDDDKSGNVSQTKK